MEDRGDEKAISQASRDKMVRDALQEGEQLILAVWEEFSDENGSGERMLLAYIESPEQASKRRFIAGVRDGRVAVLALLRTIEDLRDHRVGRPNGSRRYQIGDGCKVGNGESWRDVVAELELLREDLLVRRVQGELAASELRARGIDPVSGLALPPGAMRGG